MSRYFLPVFYTILQMLLLMSVGFVLKRFANWPESFFQHLRAFIVKIGLPVYMFVRIAPSDISDLRSAWMFPVASVFVFIFGLILGTGMFSILPFSGTKKRTGIALSSFGNSGYIPLSSIELFPLSFAFLGKLFGINTPLLYVGAYLLVQSPLLWSVGNYLITGSGKKPKVSDIVTPPFVSISISFLFILTGGKPILYNMELPTGHIFKAMEQISAAVMPVVLISLGAMIGRLEMGNLHTKKAAVMAAGVSAVRFLFLPGIFFAAYFLILKPFGASPAQCWVLFLETHVPPATNISVMLGGGEEDKQYTAFTMLVTYLLYLFIFPFFVILFFSLPGLGLTSIRH